MILPVPIPPVSPTRSIFRASAHTSRFERVLHEHCDGHRADPAGNRRQHRGNLFGSALIDIAGPDVTTLLEIFPARRVLAKKSLNLCAVGNFVRSDVDHNCAGLDPFASDHRGFADGGNDNVGLANNLAQIACF